MRRVHAARSGLGSVYKKTAQLLWTGNESGPSTKLSNSVPRSTEPASARSTSRTLGRFAAVLCSLASASIAVLAIFMRLGLDDMWVPVCGLSFGYACLIFNLPVVLQEMLAGRRVSVLESVCFLTAVTIVGSAILCRLGGFWSGLACSLVGLVCLLINVRAVIGRFRRDASYRLWVPILVGGILTGIALSGVTWGRGPLSPLFDAALLRGVSNQDTLFHMSICNMIRNYGIPSTGLDGVPMLAYHCGSHYFLGMLADGFSASAVQAYNVSYPIVVAPLFVYSFVLAGIGFIRQRATGDSETQIRAFATLWAIVMVAVIGFLPSPIGNAMGLRPSFLVSESMCLALIFASLAMGVILPKLALTVQQEEWKRVDAWIIAACFPVFLGVVGITKVSIVAIGGALVGWLFLRDLRLRKNWLALGSAAASFAVALAVIQYGSGASSQVTRIEPFRFLFQYVSGVNRVFYFPVSLAWLALACAARFRELKISSWEGLRARLRARELMDVELLLVAAVVGFLISMTIAPASSGYYFHNIQQWIAVVILLGVYARRISRPRAQIGSIWSTKLRFASPATVLLPLILLLNVSINTVRFASEAIEARSIPTRLRSGSTAESAVQKHRGTHALLAAFDGISRLVPPEQRRHTAIYIPRANHIYWDFCDGKKWAIGAPFLAPALTGLAMVDGAPRPHPDLRWELYGYGLYDIYDSNRRRLAPATIGELAKSHGFRRVLTIESDVDCTLVTEWSQDNVATKLVENDLRFFACDDRVGTVTRSDRLPVKR